MLATAHERIFAIGDMTAIKLPDAATEPRLALGAGSASSSGGCAAGSDLSQRAEDRMMPMGSMMGWDGGGWGMGFGAVSMLLSWIVVIVVVVAAIRWFGSTAGIGGAPARGGDRALEILRERYARGEIGKEEFDAKRRDIGG